MLQNIYTQGNSQFGGLKSFKIHRSWQEVYKIYKKEDVFVDWVFKVLGDLKGKKILDCGCGDGKSTSILAEMGSFICGIDISYEIISRAKKRLVGNKISNRVNLINLALENTGFKDNSFDIVFGGYILHHVNLESSISEIYRILSPRGIAIFIETFATNPILMFFKNHIVGKFGIPKFGTMDEHPLNYRDINMMIRKFKKVSIMQPDFQFLKLIDRQIIRYHSSFISDLFSYKFFYLFDRWIWSAFSELRKYSYTQVIIVEK